MTRTEVATQSAEVVKGEGEKPFPISLSYINTNTSCIFIFLEQECSHPTFTFTLHHSGSQVGALFSPLHRLFVMARMEPNRTRAHFYRDLREIPGATAS